MTSAGSLTVLNNTIPIPLLVFYRQTRIQIVRHMHRAARGDQAAVRWVCDTIRRNTRAVKCVADYGDDIRFLEHWVDKTRSAYWREMKVQQAIDDGLRILNNFSRRSPKPGQPQ